MGKITEEQLALIKLAIQAVLRMLGLAKTADSIKDMTEEELTEYLASVEERKEAVDERLKNQ